MGRHSEWRKQMKKLRRKRIRQAVAEKRNEVIRKEKEEREKSPNYKQWLAEEEAAQKFQEEEEKRISLENERKWLETEKEAQRQWQELQVKLAHIREERRKQDERIYQEWQKEQNLIQEAKEKKEEARKAQERQEELFKQQVEEYITNDGPLPEELHVPMETNPNKPVCPFFSKTGVCRFNDACSRNHIRPRVSTILLFPSFYNHFSLEQSSESEYGSDLMLEYEESETYNHFSEFFHDILPEFQKYGSVRQLKVCCNKEPHLRGNVYLEFDSTRDAVKTYKMFQGRWYGGKQLNVEFCSIPSWKTAICGLNFRKKCPKGSSCNFLHVFRNPGRMFEDIRPTPVHYRDDRSERNDRTYESSRNWRWSVTPDRDDENSESRIRQKNKSDEYSDENEKYKRKYRHKSDRTDNDLQGEQAHRKRNRTDDTRKKRKKRRRSPSYSSQSHSKSPSSYKEKKHMKVKISS